MLYEYTQENLNQHSRNIRDLRRGLLADQDDAGADAESEQFYLLALSALETAQRYMTLAAYKQSQAIR